MESSLGNSVFLRRLGSYQGRDFGFMEENRCCFSTAKILQFLLLILLVIEGLCRQKGQRDRTSNRTPLERRILS